MSKQQGVSSLSDIKFTKTLPALDDQTDFNSKDQLEFEDIFSEEVEEVDEVETKEEPENKEEKSDSPKKEEKTAEEEADDFFENLNKRDTSVLNKDDKKEKKKADEEEEEEETIELENEFAQQAHKLIEAGVFSYIKPEVLEEIEDEDDLLALHQVEIQEALKKEFQSFAEEMDDDGREFIKFKRNGGRTEDFFKAYKAEVQAPKLVSEDDTSAEKFARYYLGNVENREEEEIEILIEKAKEDDKLQALAKKYDTKHKAAIASHKEKIRTAQKQKQENDRKVWQKYQTTLNSKMKDKDMVRGLPMTDTYAKEIDKTIFQKNKQGLTRLEESINNIFDEGNEEKLIVLAALANSDFDIEQFVGKHLDTKATRKLKDKAKKYKPKVGGKGSSNTNSGTLASLF